MLDETRPAEHLPPVQKRRGWPWVLGNAVLLFGHVGFFLPFRAVVPVPEWVDPWWAIALVLVDEAVGMLLIFSGVAKVRREIIAEHHGERD